MLRLLRLRFDFAYWWATRNCPHHPAFLRSELVNLGMGKMWWCEVCDHMWFL